MKTFRYTFLMAIASVSFFSFMYRSPAQELDAPPQAIIDAAHAACSRYALYEHDVLRREPSDEPLPAVPMGPATYQLSDERILDIYNTFNLRGAAGALGAYADRVDEESSKSRRYSDAQCRVLVPAYALARTVLTLNVRPLDISFGGLIDRCRMDGIVHPCLRRSLVTIPARCDIPASSDRFTAWCRSPAAADTLTTEAGPPAASPRTDLPATTSNPRDDF